MCRSIKPLFNFAPPVTEEEIRAASLQFVRKISGFNKPSKANEDAFLAAVDGIAARRQHASRIAGNELRRPSIGKSKLRRRASGLRIDSRDSLGTWLALAMSPTDQLREALSSLAGVEQSQSRFGPRNPAWSVSGREFAHLHASHLVDLRLPRAIQATLRSDAKAHFRKSASEWLGARIPHAGRRRACRLARPRSVGRSPGVEMTSARLARAVVYRNALPEDIAACIELRGKTRENAISVERCRSAGITLESWTRDVADGALPGHVALSGGKIVGYCFGSRTPVRSRSWRCCPSSRAWVSARHC